MWRYRASTGGSMRSSVTSTSAATSRVRLSTTSYHGSRPPSGGRRPGDRGARRSRCAPACTRPPTTERSSGLADPDLGVELLGRRHQPDARVDVGLEAGQRVDHEQDAGHAAPSRIRQAPVSATSSRPRAATSPRPYAASYQCCPGAAPRPPGGAVPRRGTSSSCTHRDQRPRPAGRCLVLLDVGEPHLEVAAARADRREQGGQVAAASARRTASRRPRTRRTPSPGPRLSAAGRRTPCGRGPPPARWPTGPGPVALAKAAARNGPARLSSRHCSSPARPGHQSRQTWVEPVRRIITRPAGPMVSKWRCIATYRGESSCSGTSVSGRGSTGQAWRRSPAERSRRAGRRGQCAPGAPGCRVRAAGKLSSTCPPGSKVTYGA